MKQSSLAALVFSLCLSSPLWASPTTESDTTPSTSLDSDRDGLHDALEERIGTDPILADSDGDGIKDGVEVGTDSSHPRNSDKDRRIDALDVDDDGDGLPTLLECACDSDQDGTPDYLDLDSDNDGIPDRDEGGLTGKDHDRDSIDDHYDSDKSGKKDKNGDGITDGLSLPDRDRNGLADARQAVPKGVAGSAGVTAVAASPSQPKQNSPTKPQKAAEVIEVEVSENPTELSMVVHQSAVSPAVRFSGHADTDGDGIADELELGLESNHPVDSDSDGIFDFLDADDDGDGVKTRIEGEGDRDGDGRVNYLDADASGYFYCASNGRIVGGIRSFRVLPLEDVQLYTTAKDGRYRWLPKKPGTYTLQFILPRGMSTSTELERGQLAVSVAQAPLLNLGLSESVAKEGYLAGFNPKQLAPWYSSFRVQANAPPMINHNIPLIGGECGEAR